MAKLVHEPRSQAEASLDYTRNYVDSLFVKQSQSEFVPGGLIVESQRQRMRLPYHWLGAAIG